MENEKVKKQGSFKSFLIGLAAVLLIAVVLGGVWLANYLYFGNWVVRYKSTLDDFFGEGNWEVASDEIEKEFISTTIYDESGTHTVHLPYRNWTILASDGEEYTITNHTYLISKRKSGNKYTPKQALIQQLMFISHEHAGMMVLDGILSEYLSESETACLDVSISWRNGNPKPAVYSKLANEDWFSYQSTAADWLSTDLYDFYLWIRAYDYRVEKLTEEEQAHLRSSEGDIVSALQQAYGTDAEYEIYLT